MRLSLQKLIQSANESFIEGTAQLSERRKQWGPFADRLYFLVSVITDDSKNRSTFDRLHILDSRKTHAPRDSLRFVSIWWGSRAVALDTPNDPKQLAIEQGATITFAQAADGSVVTVIYPFESEIHRPHERNIIVEIFKNPCAITDGAIYSSLKAFVAYSLVTSLHGAPSIRQKILVTWLRAKDKWRKKRKGKLVLSFVKV
jgi:hypothetical protein